MKAVKPASLRVTGILGIVAVASLMGLCAAAAAPQDAARREDAWRASIARTPVPRAGCFKASYPLAVWTQVDCVAAPQRPYLPARRAGGWTGTTGDGNDYAAVVSGLTSSAVGYFPIVKGLKTETDGGRANTYSLQLNSNFMTSKACAGAANPKTCQGWEQFVYSSSSDAAFMQYWLIDYANKCPSGWFTYSTDCYKNSAAVRVPLQVIKQLKNMKLSGSAVTKGTDTLVLTTKRDAYSTTGNDNVVYLAADWKASEFNIVGDGGGSAAVFNPGTSLTVEIDVTDGTTTAPTCQSHDGTTGETNNLNLGSCTTAGGSVPSVKFTEALSKK